jgi:class 3 adenylate cyclase
MAIERDLLGADGSFTSLCPAIIRGVDPWSAALWSGWCSDPGGRHAFDGLRITPTPIRSHLPTVIGGSGERKTLRSVARWADTWNAFGSPEELAAKDAILRRQCAEVGRDESAIERTVGCKVTHPQALRDLRRMGPSVIFGLDVRCRRRLRMAGAQKRNLDAPDERVAFEGIAADVVQLGGASISRSVMQPGSHCALGGRVLSGDRRAEQSCQAHHTGLLLEGRLHIEMDDGSLLDIVPNDVFDIPPGHDGWVVSEEPLQSINWSGVRTWLPMPDQGERVLATLLFTDIVGSTAIAERLGDTAWRELLGRHDRAVRDVLDRFRGREVTTTGDGFLAIFDAPGRAIRAASAIRERSSSLGLEIRAGIHTGEVELVGSDVQGLAVHEAARIAAHAGPAEILLSATTRQLAAGPEFTFRELGARELKGLSGTHMLYVVEP